jgi:hypothetical protein
VTEQSATGTGGFARRSFSARLMNLRRERVVIAPGELLGCLDTAFDQALAPRFRFMKQARLGGARLLDVLDLLLEVDEVGAPQVSGERALGATTGNLRLDRACALDGLVQIFVELELADRRVGQLHQRPRDACGHVTCNAPLAFGERSA